MKIIFFGTSAFAVPSLETLRKSKYNVICVITQPDKKKGRHLIPSVPPVKDFAVENKIPILQPTDLKTIAFVKTLKDFDADLFVVVAYGNILPKEVLKVPKILCINLHGSLLPQYRGAAPINWAVINGDRHTGVTIIKVVEELDAGPIILKKETDIKDDEDAEKLGIRLANLGASALLEAINSIQQNNFTLEEQDHSRASYAPKLEKQDGLIDWNQSPRVIHEKIRGYQPWPGAFTYYKQKLIKIFKSKVLESVDSLKPGRIVEILKHEGIVVEAQNGGCLLLQEIQPEGKKRMGAYEFALGHKLQIGEILGAV